MPIIKIDAVKNVSAFLRYATKDPPHSKGKQRFIAKGSGLCTPGHEVAEMRMTFDHFRSGRKNESKGVIATISFHVDELAPNDPADQDKACEVVEQIIETQFPGHQYFYVLQNDGRSGCLHAHIFINGKNFLNGNPITGDMKNWNRAKHTVDEVCAELGVRQLANEKSARVRTSQAEREMLADGKTSKKQMIRDRIDEALISAPSDFDEFKAALDSVEIDIEETEIRKGKNKGKKRYRYVARDIKGTRKGKETDKNFGVTDTKLGEKYLYDTIQDVFTRNKTKKKTVKEKNSEKDKNAVIIEETPPAIVQPPFFQLGIQDDKENVYTKTEKHEKSLTPPKTVEDLAFNQLAQRKHNNNIQAEKTQPCCVFGR